MTPIFADYQPYHSDFQIQNIIVIKNGGTLFGCYLQVLREVERRLMGLAQSPLRQGCLPAVQGFVPVEPEFAGIVDYFQLRYRDDTLRELLQFLGLAFALKQKIGPLTSERRRELDLDLWAFRTRKMAAIDLISNGRLSSQTIELFQVLPISLREPIARELFQPAGQERLVTWFLNYDPQLPEPSPVSLGDLQEYIAQYFPSSSLSAMTTQSSLTSLEAQRFSTDSTQVESHSSDCQFSFATV